MPFDSSGLSMLKPKRRITRGRSYFTGNEDTGHPVVYSKQLTRIVDIKANGGIFASADLRDALVCMLMQHICADNTSM